MGDSIYNSVLIKDLMTSPIITVTLNHKVSFVLKLSQKHKVTGFPIVSEQNKLIGLISTFDLIQEIAIGKENLKLGELPLIVRVDKEVITVKHDLPVKEAIIPMLKHRIGRIVINDDQGKVCGILSRKDIVNFFIKTMNL